MRIYRSDNPHSYENNYHCDGLWRPNPAMGAVLRCIECPEIGGDTIWVNMVKAYEELPEEVKRKLDGLRARASIEQSFGAVMTPEARAKLAQDHPAVEHPVVRTHPETGEKVLFVGAGFTTHFTNYSTPANVRHGIDKAPGAALLLNYLISRATIPEYRALVMAARRRRRVGQPLHPALRPQRLLAGAAQDGARRHHRRHPLLSARAAALPRSTDPRRALPAEARAPYPETPHELPRRPSLSREPAAADHHGRPYAPGWLPSDFPEDIPVTMEAQIQKAVDCYNAGATVLHLHVRELDGKGSKRLSKFNELIAGVRAAVPEMIIRWAVRSPLRPRTRARPPNGCRTTRATCWPSWSRCRTGHGDRQHLADERDRPRRGRRLPRHLRENPAIFHAYKEMTVPAQPGWVEEHVRRLSARGIQSAFQCYNTNSFESVERLMRRGFYKGPLVMNWVAIGGGMDTPNVYSLANFMRGVPDGAVVTVESNVRNVLPVNMMGIAMGLHVRCGTEDVIWNQKRSAKMSTVEQIEQLVRISREFGRDIASARRARDQQDRRLLRLGGGIPCRRTASRPTATAAPRASCARRIERGGSVRGRAGMRPDITTRRLPCNASPRSCAGLRRPRWRSRWGALAPAMRTAAAAEWPARPLRILLGAPPGGTADIVARLYAVELQRALGQPVIVDYKPGRPAPSRSRPCCPRRVTAIPSC